MAKECTGADWKNIGLARWYDCKLGKLKDQELARLVGTTKHRIRHRRLLFGIAPYTVGQEAIQPFRDLLGVEPDRIVAARCGVSAQRVATYRESLAIAPVAQPEPRKQRLPVNHPVRPYKELLGLVCDQEIAKVAGVSVAIVEAVREAFGFAPVAPLPEPSTADAVPDYHGPLLGYESLFAVMSSAKISRAVGVPFQVVERRRVFLGIGPYQRVSRAARYAYLMGLVSDSVLAKLVGVSRARIGDMRRTREAQHAD